MKTLIIKPISNYPNYFVSRDGNIWSGWDEPLHTLTPRLNNKGYGRVRISNNDGYKEFLVHRLVALAFIPNPQNLPTVNHIDGNKTNNSVENLEWLSVIDNIKHYRVDNT